MYQQIARNRRRAAACMVGFFVVWVAIGAVIGWAWAVLMPVRDGATAPTGGDIATGVVIAAVLAAGGILVCLHSGARMVLTAAGARPADADRYRQLHHLVEALAIGDGLPVPQIYIIDDPAPNAFATGTDPAHAAVTVTTGLLATMNREELEGVLAHEVSHIKNHDVRLLLVVSTLIGLAGLLATLVWRSSFALRGRGRQSQQIVAIALLAGLLLSVVAFLFGPLVRLALSRRRESLADVSGVALTRNPAGLIRALQKLQVQGRSLAGPGAAMAAMCIHDPRRGHGHVRRLFDSHPPLEQRIAVLERLADARTV